MAFYTPKAPFEVLQTNWLSFDDILFLKDIEDMVEIYYNSGRFQTILTYMIQEFETPFDFFAQLGSFLHCKQISPIQSFKRTILRNFVLLLAIYQSYFTETMKQLCIYDICLHEKPKTSCFYR